MPADTYITIQLEECVKGSLSLTHKLPSLYSELRRFLQTIDSPMQVAVLGRVSSSKSTFVNALLEDEILLMDKFIATFLVFHLKYGEATAPIVKVYKDGHCDYVPRKELSEWEEIFKNRENEDGLLNPEWERLWGDLKNVLCIELTYPCEILKSINIIDTPGLDSTMGDDSKNTIDYLEKVRPDAIIMLFTKGAIPKETLDVVRKYIGSEQKQLNISPLNAVGLYTKIDEIWKISSADASPRFLAEQTIKDNIYGLYPEIHDSLYSIFPVCARLGLATSTMTHEDLRLFQVLSCTQKEILQKMLLSDSLFSSSKYETETHLTSTERAYLKDKYGKYGVYAIIEQLHKGNHSIEQIKEMLDDISGMKLARKRLMSHFGERAVLIKTQNTIARIIKTCTEERKEHPDCIETINQIERNILRTMRNIKEYNELDYLARLYDGLANELDAEAVEEFKTVCGESENGNSVVKRLGISNNVDIEEIRRIIAKRISEANRKANLKMISSPQNAELYLMLVQSYQQLDDRITSMLQKKEEAERTLRIAKDFFFGE